MHPVDASAGPELFRKRRRLAREYLGFARVGEYEEELVEILEESYLGRGGD